MFVRPAPCAYIGPELRFFVTADAHSDMTREFSGGSFNRPMKYVADLDRPIVALAEQVQSSDPSQRADLMKHWGPAVQKKTLNHIQRGRAQFLEYAESETLRDGRVDAVIDRVCPTAFNPPRAAVGE